MPFLMSPMHPPMLVQNVSGLAQPIDLARDWTTNLLQPTYYNGTYPFINLFYSGVGTWDTPSAGSAVVDPATGDLTLITDGTVVNRRLIFGLVQSEGGYAVPGGYVCDAAGSGMWTKISTLSSGSALTSMVDGTNASNPESTFTITGNGSKNIILTVQYTNNTGATIARMHAPYIGLVTSRGTYNAAVSAGSPGDALDPGMIADLTGVRAIKFSDMNGQNTNSDITLYSQLNQESYTNWSGSGFGDNGRRLMVPYSVTSKIAKRLGCINWMSLPPCYNFNYYSYAGGAPAVFTNLDGTGAARNVAISAASPAVVTTTGSTNPWFQNQPIEFPVGGGTLPTGLTAGVVYFISLTGLTSTTFQISATVGGASINTTGTAGSTVCNMVEAHGWADKQPIGLWDYNIRPQSGLTVTVATPAVFGGLGAHGLVGLQKIWFTTTGALPTGLSVNTTYYVDTSTLTSTTFQVSATSGGSVINTTGTQSGTHSINRGPVGLTWATQYYARVIDAYHFSIALTPTGTGVTLPGNVLLPAGGYNISGIFDPTSLWTSILNEVKAANPSGIILPQVGLEVWNSGYYLNVAQGLWSGVAGVPGDAGAGYAWMLMTLWKCVETVFPRSQYIRSTDNQAANFAQLASAYTYSDPAGLLFPGQTVAQLLNDGNSSAIAAAPYCVPQYTISATATMTIATPGVFTTAAGFSLYNNAAVTFSTTGALPTGITAGTTYFVVGSSIVGQTCNLSTTANGTALATSGTQSGTHTITLAPVNAGIVTLIAAGFTTAANSVWRDNLITSNNVTSAQAAAFFAAAAAAAPGIPILSYEGGHETFFGASPGGIGNVTMTIASPGVITAATASLIIANMSVAFSTTGALPTGLVAGTAYYVVGSSINVAGANTFQVSATPNGSAINTTGTQSGTHSATTSTSDVAALSTAYQAFWGSAEAATWFADYVARTLRPYYRTLNWYPWVGKWDLLGTSYGAKPAFNVADSPMVTAIKALQLVKPVPTNLNVASSTPSRITVTMNEAINPVLPAASAFAYTGSIGGAKTIGAPVYVDRTHFYLPVSPPFGNGDAGTVSLTQPGTNKLQDVLGVLALNSDFTSIAVTNNVRAPARTDNFTRTTSTTTINNPSDGLSPLWVPETGTWGINGNQGYCVSTTGDNKVLLDTGNFDDDVTFQYLQTDHFGGCIFRYASAGNFLLINATDHTNNQLQFYDCIGGTYTLRATSASNVVTPAALNLLRVVYVGNSINIYSNGTLVLTLTNTNFLTATKIGLRSPSPSGSNDPRWALVTTS